MPRNKIVPEVVVNNNISKNKRKPDGNEYTNKKNNEIYPQRETRGSKRLKINKAKEETSLTDQEFQKKIEDTKKLAEALNNNFAVNREGIKSEINVIHKNFMKNIKKDTKIYVKAETYYEDICRTHTSSSPYNSSGNRETDRQKFREAVQKYLDFVQKYLDFVQAYNIIDKVENNDIEDPLLQAKGRTSDEIRYLYHKSKIKALAGAEDAITIDFKEKPPQAKNPLWVSTGGTIASVIVEGGKIVQPSVARKEYNVNDKDTQAFLLSEYNKRYKDAKEHIPHEEIMETLSEDMIIKDWIKLAKELNGILDKIESGSEEEKCDGIVLTHGSDTLGYTANFLALLLADRKLKVPVVLASSNYPLEHLKANGVENFKGALDFLTHVDLPPNVYVAENSKYKDEVEIILASRATQCQSITDNYRSTSIGKEGQKPMRPLGVIKDDKFIVSDKELYQELKDKKRKDIPTFNLLEKINLLEKPRILHIRPEPGLIYDYDLDKYDVVFHETYHGASACTAGDEENLLNFAEKCYKEGKDLYFGPIYGDKNRDLYNSTIKIVATNRNRDVLPLMNLSSEMALVKLRFAYALYPKDAKARDTFIYTDINHEYVYKDTRLNRERRYKGKD